MRFKIALLILGIVFFRGLLRADPVRTLPMEYRDGLIWVEVESSGHALHFVLDSGAGSSVLNLETANRLGVKLGEAQKVQAVGSQAVARRARGFVGNASGVVLNCSPLAVDLSSVSRSCSRPIDGLIGSDFFHGRIVQIDFKARCIRLLEKTVTGSGCAATLPLQFHNDALCIPVGVDGEKPHWTRLDTGCDTALHWVAGNTKDTRSMNPSLALSRSKNESSLVTVQLGGERLEGVKTVFHSDSIFSGEAGLLGNGILSKYRVTIDSVSKRVLFEK